MKLITVYLKVTVVCDWIVLTFMKKKNIYKEQKYSYVDDFELVSGPYLLIPQCLRMVIVN